MFSPSSDINLFQSLFVDRDHLRSNMGIISGPGSFAVQFGDHLRSGIICGSIWGSFAVRDHLRFNLGIICGPGSFADPYSAHSKAVLDDSFVTVDITSLDQHKLYYCTISRSRCEISDDIMVLIWNFLRDIYRHERYERYDTIITLITTAFFLKSHD